MKNLIFGLIATVFFGLVANAQKISNDEARTSAAKLMVEFKNSLQFAYNESRSFEDFIKTSTGPYNPQGTMTTEGRNMLKVAYNYLANKTSNELIIKSYDGKEIALGLKYLKDNNSLDNEGALFGISKVIYKSSGGKGGPSVNFDVIPMNSNSNFKCCFFCLSCHLQTIFGEAAAEVIVDAIVDWALSFLKK